MRFQNNIKNKIIIVLSYMIVFGLIGFFVGRHHHGKEGGISGAILMAFFGLAAAIISLPAYMALKINSPTK